MCRHAFQHKIGLHRLCLLVIRGDLGCFESAMRRTAHGMCLLLLWVRTEDGMEWVVLRRTAHGMCLLLSLGSLRQFSDHLYDAVGDDLELGVDLR